MSYLSLYRQWRPQFFEDIVGQEHIVRTLRNAIQNGRVVHAYMFAGPRGTGKTSTAKVFAKALNCAEGPTVKPCGECVSCLAVKEGNALDVIEIDAASNRGIDEIRDLRDKVRFSPSQGRYKVYIIDEVHMLTMEAFNALLKTLEEPPSHAIFVLATTEANRVPSTILSRCQRFDFNRLNVSQLSSHLSKVCSQMGVEFDKEALTLIARRAEGSARDALGLLEQVSASGERITSETIADLLGATSFDKLSAIAHAIAGSRAGELYPLLSDTLASGTDPRQLLGEIGEHFMDLLLSAECPDRKDLLHSGEDRFKELSAASVLFERTRLRGIIREIGIGLAEVAKASNPRLTLELFLARLIQPESISLAPGVSEKRAAEHEAPHAAQTKEPKQVLQRAAAAPEMKSQDAPKPEAKKADITQKSSEAKREIQDESKEAPTFWTKILGELRRKSIKVEAFARQAKPVFDGKTLTLEYSQDWGFHQQKMKEAANLAVLQDIVRSVAGEAVELRCVMAGEGESAPASAGKRTGTEAAASPSPSEKEAPAQPVGQEAKPKVDEEKVKENIDKIKALFSEVEIEIVEE